MAKGKAVEKVVEETTQEQVVNEPIYSRDELISAAASFGVKPEVVAGALRLAGKNEMTRPEAESAIKKFLERTV